MPSQGQWEHLVITAGSGCGSTPLNAFDGALHTGPSWGPGGARTTGAGVAAVNLRRITSIVPRRNKVWQIEPGTVPVDVDGLIIDAVFGEYTVEPGSAAVISAGIGLALDPDGENAGVIFRLEGEFGPDECDARLEGMCREGMVNLRGAAKMEYRSAVAASRPGDAPPGQVRSVCGVALLLVDDDQMDLYRPVCRQIWPDPVISRVAVAG